MASLEPPHNGPDRPNLDVLGHLPVAACADPDLAQRALERLAESCGTPVVAQALADPLVGARLVAVVGASAALGEELVRNPLALPALAEPGLDRPLAQVRSALLTAIDAAPDPISALRNAYREALVRIAADDLTAADPLAVLPSVAAALADLATAALEGALAVARLLTPGADGVRLAVIGLGKTGGRELNYLSDVDVMYVAEPGMAGVDALTAATPLATCVQRVVAGPGAAPPLWPVDAALRPEGKAGPLVRTLDSYLSYYQRWAEPWEFQALLKARPLAGDLALGQNFCDSVAPLVWQVAGQEGFVAQTQAMRRRVEAQLPRAEGERQIKLGRGGLRDVEFTVQLLQLVHGRTDPTVHSANTLEALAELARAGYVGREAAARLDHCYRFLRVLEHRCQLFRLRRTHLLPTSRADLRRLGRSMSAALPNDPAIAPADALLEQWQAVRREVRELHLALFYRPLLPEYARLSADDISLTPEVAAARFAAIGYRDPQGAIRHVAALTAGTSRRALLQRHLLPLLLGWFAQGADPDGGLLAFRQLSDELGGTHWYLKLLRDSGSAARTLAEVLATSKYLAQALARSPESVQWFDDPQRLIPLASSRLAGEAAALVGRSEQPRPGALALRALRRRELARIAAAELLGHIDLPEAARAISEVTDTVLHAGLQLAISEVLVEFGLAVAPTQVLLVALGRLGGWEMGYGSDADVLFVHEPLPQADQEVAATFALAVATRLRELLGAPGEEPPLEVDADLRPEGRHGPLVRTLDSYREYFQRWSSPWEAQALLRARPLATVGGLPERLVAIIDPVRYPARGLDGTQLREIRRLKARMEAERLPRGLEPRRHLKLGPGGLADVEWTTQLLQLRHADQCPGLRTTSTLGALDATEAAGLLSEDDARALRCSWLLASRLRSALVLATGRTKGRQVEVLPTSPPDLAALVAVLRDEEPGCDPSAITSPQLLLDRYLRVARQAREVVERVFYGKPTR